VNGGLIYGCVVPHPPIVVPAVGGARGERVRRTREALRAVSADIARLSPSDLVVISPHAPLDPWAMSMAVAQRFAGDFADFGAPSVRFSFDGSTSLPDVLERECAAAGVPLRRLGRQGDVRRLDHGAAVPLFFLNEAGVRGRLLLLAFSALDRETHLRFGRAIAAAARGFGGRVALVASGDFSHRLIPGAPAGYSPAGKQFDEAIVSAVRTSDRDSILQMDEKLVFEAGECGYRSLLIALGALPEAPLELLSYEGPFGVGYLVARFRLEGAAEASVEAGSEQPGRPAEEEVILQLARRAVESYVKEGTIADPPPNPEGILAERAGVFVSLKIGGELRGCIGTYLPTEPNIAAEIVRNAVAAASRDPRFPPVSRSELPYLEYSVDILSPPEPVDDIGQLDPKRFGVIVQSGAKRGLLLPDLEGVTTAAQQVEIARRKAGIPSWAPVQLYRFTVRRVREDR